ncbi:class I SAM-dependent rRNA methyltransferase [Thermodesulfovibrio sp. Kuro-1]|uniref:class I SAM-dependent rRNA methyltransferase n=1 Tax=Thermodesulfovibrio sp. Kuro-1 TaxID=2580394 RepID=UPI001144000D|nr:class I SAM-dependent rRNA methyltransferase [Thermodesulfovibrio sp. Kuro-1]
MEKIFVKPLKRHGSLWIYQNEILSDITHINAGSLVKVFEEKTNKIIGTGYINPQSVIAVRLLSFGDEQINKNFLRERIQKSHKYREDFLGLKESYRLIFSESDFLPGLIVDKYGKCLVIQILTAGMERLKDLIVEILDKLLVPEVIILRNDAQPRVKEGLKVEKMVIKGCVDNLIMTKEDDLKFYFDPLHGQKTGFFLDQRENRLYLKSLISSGEGLDLFCYVGAWSIHLAKRGANITGIDSSEKAIEIAKQNAMLNNVQDKCRFIKADVFDYLRWEAKKGKKYDFIVVDPPAFVKSRQEKKDAIESYVNLNRMALKLLRKNGILATSSCSQHISETDFLEIIKKTFKASKKTGILLYKGTQSKDHPILLTMPETSYLKCLMLRVF